MPRFIRSSIPLLMTLAALAACNSGASPNSGVCGDGALDPGELCDGNALGGETCTTQGAGAGALTCKASCDGFDTDACCEPSCDGRTCGLDPVCGASCGTCASGTCSADGQCVGTCEPRTCAEVGAMCGVVDDGCGNALDCGGCTSGKTCGGGGTPNQCGVGPCTVTTCTAEAAECGVIDDGCGTALACGTCTGSETCGGGGTPNQCGGSPTVVPWTAISAGGFHTCGVKVDGTLWCWGRNDAGQIGLGTQGGSVAQPTRVGVSFGWTAVSAGFVSTCGINYDHLYCWGDNSSGQIGDNTRTDRASPTVIQGTKTWVALDVGYSTACATDSMGDVYCWGNNTYQQLSATLGDRLVPTYAGRPSEYAVGGGHICRRTTPHVLYCRGLNSSGQLGTNSADSTSAIEDDVWAPTTNWQWWSKVFLGGSHSCGFGSIGTLVCWGNNQYGQLGNPIASPSVANYVDGLSDWATMGLGDAHTCGVKENGSLLCWGANDAGQVGDGSMTNRAEPVLIGGGFRAVTGGYAHSCALGTDDRLWCWGSNGYKQLGTGGGNATQPVEVP